MAKISSYRKMKDKKDKEIADLREQLLKIAANPTSFEAMQIITTWRMKADIERAIMYGDATNQESSFIGILSAIKPSDDKYHVFENKPLTQD